MNNSEAKENINKILEIKDILENGINKLKLVLFRHGPKKEATGEKDDLADYFSTQIKDSLNKLDLKSSSYIHILSGPADRAQKTREVAAGYLEDGENVKVKPASEKLGTFENLSEKLKSELNTLVQYQEELEKRIKTKESDKDYDSQESKQELKNKIDSIILENMFDDTLDELKQELNLDKTLSLSTKDFSQNLENYTRGYLKHLGMLKSEKDKPVSLNITHSYPIMSFLKNNLRFIEVDRIESARDMQGKEFLDKVGGCINETESVSLDYIEKGNRKLIRVKGNNFEGYIDYDE